MAAEMARAGSSGMPELQGQRLLENPVVRQLGVMVGIALSVALGVAVVLWSQTPGYSPLYASLSQKDASEVMDALKQAGIEFQVDPASGSVSVPTADLDKARMHLAGLGLPKGGGMGFELLEQDTGFGTSRRVEAARYQRAMEGELARTISSLSPVDSARVHLATPKQSVFVRDRKHPSASVVLKLHSGRVLDKGQVASIVHLVASSVPDLMPSGVTVVDQRGRLLSGEDRTQGIGLSSAQLDYTRELEDHYRQRVLDILVPVLGQDAVRAEVAAELDFTLVEKTQESFNPDQPALRSEQSQEDLSKLSAVQGVPGALTNQPPAAGTAPEQAAGGGNGEAVEEPLNSSKRVTRNFELDKTISHTRLPTGTLRRLSVAVVVDDRLQADAEGAVTQTPRTPEELSRLETLVREAIGYSEQRGDSVQIVNAAFKPPLPVEPLPEPPLWEQAWFWDLMRQLGGLLLVLLLIFGVLRPTMKRLTAPAVVEGAEGAAGAGAGAAGGPEATFAGREEGLEGALGEADEAAAALPPGEKVRLPGPGSYENTLEAARQLVRDDPKRVAQVVRRWIAEEAA
jgi:flagellar M-ring protein FliF